MHIPGILIVLFAGILAGQVAAVSFGFGARVTLLDLAVAVAVIYSASVSRRDRNIPVLWQRIFAFLSAALLSLAASWESVPLYVLGGGLLYVFRWLLYAALYRVAKGATVPARRWYALLACGGTAIAVAGFIQYLWYPDLRNLSYLGWDPHYRRLFSSLLDPNFTGIVLVATVLLLLGAEIPRRFAPWRWAGLMVSAGALLLTYSRSSLVALVVGLVVWGVLVGKKTLVAGVLVMLTGLLFILPNTGEGQNLLRSVSSYARLGSMERALSLMREKPVFGYGFNTLRFVARERSWIDETVVPSRAGAGVDTSMLFVGATTGVVGLSAYLWLIVGMLRLGVSGLGKDPRVRPWAAVYVATLSAILVHSIFINSLFYPWVMAWMWIMTGALEQQVRVRTGPRRATAGK